MHRVRLVRGGDGFAAYDADTRTAAGDGFHDHPTCWRAWFGLASDFGNQPQNVFDKWDPINFGPTDADERHRFVISGIFDLPWDFQVAPIFQIASARPYSILPACGVCDINRRGRQQREWGFGGEFRGGGDRQRQR